MKKTIIIIMLFAGLAYSIWGLVQILSNPEKKFDPSESEQTIFGRDDMSNMMNLSEENAMRKTKREDGAKKMGIGIVVIVIGLIAGGIKTRKKVQTSDVISQLEKLGKLKENNLVTDEEFEIQKKLILDSQKEDTVSSSSIFDFGSLLGRTGAWAGANKKWLQLLAIVLVLGFVIYYFFIKNNPDRDGKKSASNVCNCNEKYNQEAAEIYGEFLTKFDSYSFKNRQEAREKMNELLKTPLEKRSQCLSAATQKSTELRGKYLSQPKDLAEFDKAGGTVECSKKEESVVESRYAQFKSAVSKLEEPPPGADRMKSDLLGQKIPSWNFDYLNEFNTFNIKSTSKGNSRMEIVVVTELKNKDGSVREAELLIVYESGDGGWIFKSVKANYIAFSNKLSAEKWSVITPLAGCTMKFDLSGKFVMKCSEDGQEYNFGPDSELKTVPESSKYWLKSREGKEVTIRFSYFPNK